jgi:XRE family transcriptional regulator, regulator of sulfur utilization
VVVAWFGQRPSEVVFLIKKDQAVSVHSGGIQMITRRDLSVAAVVVGFGSISVVTMLLATAWGQTEPAEKLPAEKPIMHSSVFEWDDMKVVPTGNGEKRMVCNSKTATLNLLECHVTTLNPGEVSHLPHKHWQEEIVILKEGELEALQNDDRKHAGPGAIIFEGSNELHAVKNIGSTPATYYVIQFAPSRARAAE